MPDEPKHTIESVQFLCIECPLPDCDEESPLCLIRIERRKDPKLNKQLYYYDWIVENIERRNEQRRAYAARRKVQRQKARDEKNAA